MSTASLNGTRTDSADERSALPLSLSLAESRYGHSDLTIHRRSTSHHGNTLRTLGHAAEYLVDSRLFSLEIGETAGDREAVRILMRLSREIFDEYAVIASQSHPIADWVMEKAVCVYGAA
jgi:hypothetical protein